MSTTMTATPAKATSKPVDAHLAAFDRLIEPTAGGQPGWLFPLRKAGIACFAEQGFPTVAHEDWRFTNIAPLTKLPFKPAAEDGEEIGADVLTAFTFAGLAGPLLVFVNGHFSGTLSRIGSLPTGVKVSGLKAALAAEPGLLEKHLGHYTSTADNAFAALNTAFFQDGVFIQVSAGVSVPEPVRVIYLTTATEPGTAISPRNLIIAERDAKVTVVESYVTTTGAASFTNAVTELVAGDNAQVEHVKLQDEAREAFHIATLSAHLGRHCNVSAHSFALGARLSRYNIRTRLAGQGLECVLNGLYLMSGEQLADHHMIVEHAEPHCASHEYFNGILDDKSRGVFHGRILVRPIAQKTDAKQTNKNLLLSDDATADTKPQLEIYADDVKCTHGATIGQLNDESIFYLRSRGIGLDRAKRMLIHAF
ncbi:MAG TPA: Fe-S cluster assembly protein SufD, partial [Verrucomicrobiae bacterium]|nr:Fe-S cluster assembly protein SufD [Verrucomicrobiae bacterium]